MVEGAHPYADNTDTYLPLSFPAGTTAVEIVFDEQSATETNCDYVRFYCDNTRQGIFGAQGYHGGLGGSAKLYPGVGATPSMIISGREFVVYFHSDGSNNDWGIRFTASPTTKPPNCLNPAEAAQAAGASVVRCRRCPRLTRKHSLPRMSQPRPSPPSRCYPGPACLRVCTRTRTT